MWLSKRSQKILDCCAVLVLGSAAVWSVFFAIIGTEFSKEQEGRFSYPGGVAVDDSGNVYVSERSRDRLMKFTPNGELLSEWEMSDPSGIDTDSSGNVYITASSTVEKRDTEGNILFRWTERELAALSGRNVFLEDIALGSDENVFVVASRSEVVVGRRQAIIKFDQSANMLAQWDGQNNDFGKFSDVQSIAIDSSEKIYTADNSSRHVQVFDGDGNFLTSWGKDEPVFAEFIQPRAIAVDNKDNVYVADQSIYTIQKFSPCGDLLARWKNDRELSDHVIGLDVDASGNIYAARADRVEILDANGVLRDTWRGTASSVFPVSPYLFAICFAFAALYFAFRTKTPISAGQVLSPSLGIAFFLIEWLSFLFATLWFGGVAAVNTLAKANDAYYLSAFVGLNILALVVAYRCLRCGGSIRLAFVSAGTLMGSVLGAHAWAASYFADGPSLDIFPIMFTIGLIPIPFYMMRKLPGEAIFTTSGYRVLGTFFIMLAQVLLFGFLFLMSLPRGA